jgi:serine/threonine-protein kinase RsbW
MMSGSGDDRSAPPELELEVPPRPEFVRTVRHAVAALVRLHGGDQELVEDAKLAVSEACAAALTAGGTSPLRVAGGGESGRLVVEVVDPGAGGRAVSGAPADIDTADLPFERILAIPIIRGLVDEVAVVPIPGDGATLRMVFTLGAEEAEPS